MTFLNRKKLSQIGQDERLAAALILITSITLAFRLFQMVNQKAVNLIFWDQFDFYTPLFNHMGWWDLFWWQQGTSHMGLGGILTKVVADASGWNGRAESFFILGLIYLSLMLVLMLKRRLTGRFQLHDFVFPLVVLNLYQYETFIGTPYISPSGLSLFLVCLFALCWLIPNTYLRYAAVLVTNLLAVLTGYGTVLGPVTVFTLLVDLIAAARSGHKQQLALSSATLIISLLSLGLFFYRYVFYPSAGCTGFSFGNMVRWPAFMILMFSKFAGFNFKDGKWIALISGIILLVSLATVGIYHSIRMARKPFSADQTSRIVVILIGFGFLYAGSAAVGRACQGVDQADASRYVTLLIPAFVGLLLGLSHIPRATVRLSLSFITFVLLLHSLAPFQATDQWVIDFYYEGKTSWKTCYLQIENIQACTEKTGFQIYPVVDQRIEDRFHYLKQEKLNLYLDANQVTPESK